MTTGMSTASESSVPTPSHTSPSSRWTAVVIDVAIVAVWFAVAGVLGAWIWAHVTTLPQVTKVGNAASVPSEELTKQVGMDGWFFVIALVGGLVSGILLLAWRRRDPLVMVVLVVLGGGLASWLMLHVGEAFGPGDPIAALRKLPEGAKASEQLKVRADGVLWVWSIAAAFGAVLYLWVLAKPSPEATEPDTLP